jgi:hypothetical protein
LLSREIDPGRAESKPGADPSWIHLSGLFIQISLKKIILTPVDRVTNKLSSLISLEMAERSEAKSAKQSFASKNNISYRIVIFSEIKENN